MVSLSLHFWDGCAFNVDDGRRVLRARKAVVVARLVVLDGTIPHFSVDKGRASDS